MPPKKKIIAPKYRPGNAGISEETPSLVLITVQNGDELRRAVVRDTGDMWSGWCLDRPAMLATCYPKFAWRLIMQRELNRDEHPPEKCSCNEFDASIYGPRPDGEHHKWCPINPIRELHNL